MISGRWSSDRWVAGGIAALLLLALAVLWPGVHGPFLFDDYPNLKNLAELNGRPTLRSIGVYLSLFPGDSGRPLAALSFLLNDVDWPSEPYGFKVTNLLIHLLNGVLVFGLARTLGRATGAPTDPAHCVRIKFAALAAAAIWLLSPIQVSAVFLTVQRMTELAATFLFAGLWGFFAILGRARGVSHALAALATLGTGTVLSFLCKENGALAPILAITALATIWRVRMASLSPWARRLLWAGLLLPAAVVAQVLVQRVLHAPDGHFIGRNFGLWERLMTEGRVLLDYLALIVAPRLSSSSLYYDDYVISTGLLTPVSTLPSLLVVLGLLAGGLWARKRYPLFAFAVLWFLAGHLIESTVVALEIYFEHRNYVPLFGPAFAAATLTVNAPGKLRKPALLGLLGWLVLASGLAHLQARTWGSEEKLATYWHVEHPNSLRAQQQYAQYLVKTGGWDEARSVFAAMQWRQQSAFDAEVQLIILDCDGGRVVAPERMQSAIALASATQHTPGTAMILGRLGQSVRANRCPSQVSPEAWLALTAAAIEGPNGAGIARMVRVERAELFLDAQRLDDAISELAKAYGKGKHAEPRVAFYAAALLATAGRYDEARQWAKRPLKERWSWKHWLSSTKRQAYELLEAMDEAERESKDAANTGQASKPI